MVDFRRLKGLLATLATLAAMLGAFSLLLSATLGRHPRRYLGSDWPTYTMISYQAAGGRISGVLRDEPPGERPLGVLLGASTLQWGVDPVALGSSTSLPWRWLSLPGTGSTADDLEGMATILKRSGLRPEILVLAINPGMLARSGDYLADSGSEDRSFDPEALVRHLGDRRWKPATEELGALCALVPNQAFPHRTRVNNRIQYRLLMSRLPLFERLGLGVGSLFAPSKDPWVVEGIGTPTPRVAEPGLRKQLAGLAQRGWFDPNAYDAQGPDALALGRLIARARAWGAQVAIVLLPETRAFRAMVPPESGRCLDSALARGFEGAPPLVVDLRESLPDDLFFDATHLNLDGRTVFTRRLSKALEGRLGPAGQSPCSAGPIAAPLQGGSSGRSQSRALAANDPDAPPRSP